LREVAANQHVAAYMVDNALELKQEWLAGKTRIGVTAGASAPEVLVQEVVARLRELGAGGVTELAGITERVTFPLPRNLAVEAS
jgi:4-hydroxy-3-methylbut-2-enyl diphosphate reductase